MHNLYPIFFSLANILNEVILCVIIFHLNHEQKLSKQKHQDIFVFFKLSYKDYFKYYLNNHMSIRFKYNFK